jgi:hypothetical protein
MTTVRRTAFAEALERSRRFLGESAPEPDVLKGKSTLLDHVSIRERARAEARFAARHALPSDAPGPLERLSILSGDETNYAETVHARLEAMRGRILASSPLDLETEASDLPAGTPRWVIGEDAYDPRDPLTPIWREVLDQHRGLHPAEPLGEAELGSPQISDAGPAPSSAAHAGFWPPLLTTRPGYDFAQWQRGPSNRMATQAASEVIDHPAARLNPLLIHGAAGSGKSHLLWAIGESLEVGMPDRDVRLITAETFPSEHLPSDWDDLLMEASALLIDDADRILMRPNGAEMLAKLVGWSIDIGAQVILTASRRLAADSLPIGRLRQAVSAGIHVELGTPSEATMLLLLRRQTLSRGLSLTDPQLRVITGRSRGEWTRAKADFEAVHLAMEAGTVFLGAEEVTALLAGKAPPMADGVTETVLDADAIGARIVSDVLDTVLPEPAEHRAEIISDRIEVEDDYLAPEFSLPPAHLAAERIAGAQLRGHLQDIQARGDAATSAPEIPAGSNYERLADAALDRLENVIHEHRFELSELNREITEISHRVETASADELVSFADRMLSIEGHLDTLRDLTTHEIPPFDPGALIIPIKRPVLMPAPPEPAPAMAILKPVKRRILMPGKRPPQAVSAPVVVVKDPAQEMAPTVVATVVEEVEKEVEVIPEVIPEVIAETPVEVVVEDPPTPKEKSKPEPEEEDFISSLTGTVSKKKKSSRPKPETEGPPPAKKKEKKSGIDLMAIADDVEEVSVTKAAGSGGLDLTEKEDEDDADFGDLLGKVTKS